MSTARIGRIGIVVSSLLLTFPLFAQAAYNDVNLGTSAVIVAGGVTLNISGSTTTIQSIVVTGSTVTATLLPNSSISVTAPGGQQINPLVNIANTGPFTVTNTCTTGNSAYAISANSATLTLTLSPSSTLCSSSSSSSSSSGGGGGGGAVSGPLAPGYQVPTIQSVNPQNTSNGSSNNPLASSAPSASATPPSIIRNLSRGSRGSDVLALQIFLVSTGYLSATPNGYFGAQTFAAVKAFQTAHNLPAVGSIGTQTRALFAQMNASGGNISSATVSGTGYQFAQALSVGSKGDAVLQLQKRLVTDGFLKVTPNGVFGPATQAALKAYQTKNGIEPVGSVGPATRAALNKGL